MHRSLFKPIVCLMGITQLALCIALMIPCSRNDTLQPLSEMCINYVYKYIHTQHKAKINFHHVHLGFQNKGITAFSIACTWQPVI